MHRYDMLRKNNRPTVVVLEGTSCPHCRVAIPAQRSMDVQKGEVHPCFNCKRLLFSQQALEPAG